MSQASAEMHRLMNRQGHARDSGNSLPTRLQVKPASMPEIRIDLWGEIQPCEAILR